MRSNRKPPLTTALGHSHDDCPAVPWKAEGQRERFRKRADVLDSERQPPEMLSDHADAGGRERLSEVSGLRGISCRSEESEARPCLSWGCGEGHGYPDAGRCHESQVVATWNTLGVD